MVPLTQNVMVQQNNGAFKALGEAGFRYGYNVSMGYGNNYGVNTVNAQWQRQNDFYMEGDWLYINSNSCLESRTISIPYKINIKTNQVVSLQ